MRTKGKKESQRTSFHFALRFFLLLSLSDDTLLVFLEVGELLRIALHGVLQDKSDVFLGNLHVLAQISECNLRFNHPELGKMALSVRVLSTERWPECVDASHRARVNLAVKLARDGQVRNAFEEVMAVIDTTLIEYDEKTNEYLAGE